MARVTVEDCILKVPNRFDLVLMAVQRVHEISTGSPLCVTRDNDKNSVVALREIAESLVSVEDLKENVIQGYQAHVENDLDMEEDILDSLIEEKQWLQSKEGGNLKEELLEDQLTVIDDISLEANETNFEDKSDNFSDNELDIQEEMALSDDEDLEDALEESVDDEMEGSNDPL